MIDSNNKSSYQIAKHIFKKANSKSPLVLTDQRAFVLYSRRGRACLFAVLQFLLGVQVGNFAPGRRCIKVYAVPVV